MTFKVLKESVASEVECDGVKQVIETIRNPGESDDRPS